MADDLGKYLDNLGISSADAEPEESVLSEAGFEEAEEAVLLPELIDRDASLPERTESFLVALLISFDPAFSVSTEMDEEQGELNVQVHGGDPGKLIGRAGRTLSALEYVTNAVVNRDETDPVRINIDVGGYKRRRDERLRQVASRASDTVRKTGEALELEPMTAAERRIVHMALADVPGVRTESTGEARDRRVVVLPD